MLDTFLEVFAVLFAAVNPLSKIVYFSILTGEDTPRNKRRIALKACATAFCILLAFSLVGEGILRFLGIKIESVTIAGGLLLFLVAVKLVTHGPATKQDTEHLDPSLDPSVFPLATPLIAGPTSIVACLVLMGKASGQWTGQAMVIVTMGFVVLLTFLTLLVSGRITRLLGHAGVEVMTRILGFLLAALAVQMTLDGLRNAWFS